MPTLNELTQELRLLNSQENTTSNPYLNLKATLSELGFSLHDLKEAADDQCYYASYGKGHPHILFITNLYDPFSLHTNIPDIISKASQTALTCFIAACQQLLQKTPIRGKISIFVQNKHNFNSSANLNFIFNKMHLSPKNIDFCIIGEPNKKRRNGQEINIGGLGCILFNITSFSTPKNHIDTQETSENALQNLLDFLYKIKNKLLDGGNGYFSSSTIEVLRIEGKHPYPFQAPEEAFATIQVRYNDSHTPQQIAQWMQSNINFTNGHFKLSSELISTPYISNIGNEFSLLKQSIPHNAHYSTNCTSEFSNFIKNYCSFAELGLAINNTTNAQENSLNLQEIYYQFLCHYFSLHNLS